jgi:ribonuclease P protein component
MNADETPLSAEPPRAEAPPRFPRADGDQERSQDRQRAPEAGPEEPHRLKPLTVLKQRRDFLAAARARRWAADAFMLQARDRRDDAGARVGFTCSKKVGNAVARNRAKRRLRAAAALVLPRVARPGWDYVLIGRAETTASRPFAEMLADLERGVEKIHAPRKPKP